MGLRRVIRFCMTAIIRRRCGCRLWRGIGEGDLPRRRTLISAKLRTEFCPETRVPTPESLSALHLLRAHYYEDSYILFPDVNGLLEAYWFFYPVPLLTICPR